MRPIQEPADFDIRYTYLTDSIYLKNWLKDERVLKWLPMSTENEIELAVQNWMGFSRWGASLTSTIREVPCGIGTLFLMPYQKVAHHALFKIVVNPLQRRRGIGFSLIKNLKHLANHYFHLKMLVIEIMEENPIISLLERHNFYQLFKQDRFFKTEEGYKSRICLETEL